MQGLIATALILHAVPVYAQDREAEQLYRAMEKKVLAAKSLTVVWTADGELPAGRATKFKGATHVGEGNRIRFELQGDWGPKAVKMHMISDGKQMSMRGTLGPDKGLVGPPPPEMTKLLTGSFARAGWLMPFFMAAAMPSDEGGDSKDLDKQMPVSAFKLGAKERIGNADSQIVEYVVVLNAKVKAKVKVWIDTMTTLPVKRQVDAENKELGNLIEVYSAFTLDAKLDPLLFELPK
jgi:hypothetical protein